MSAEGIAFRILLEMASREQLLDLCEPGMRSLVAVAEEPSGHISESQHLELIREAIDLGFACRDEKGCSTLLRLIRDRIPNSFVRDLAAFAGIAPVREQDIVRHFMAKPRLLESYLGWDLHKDCDDTAVERVSGTVCPKYGLRYYQLMGARNILQTLEDKGLCLYQAPTGAGKTRTAMAVVARHMCSHGPTKILWLASTRELVDQACMAFKQEWYNKGDTEAVLYGWRGGGDEFRTEHATIKNTMLVASVQLLKERRDEVAKLKDEVSLIVFDEAHQSLAPTYKGILDVLLETGNCKLLGLSATPSRAESEEASVALAEMYAKQIIKIHTDGRNPIEYLVSQEYLAKVHFKKFSYRLKNIPQSQQPTEEYSDALLDWLGKNVARNMAIVKYVKHAMDQGHSRILVFCPTILSAEYCALALKVLHGVLASYAISGRTNRYTRSSRLAKFSGDDPDQIVIFNCQVLTTGFDAPKTDAVVIARPTKSAPLYSQMIGRALRGPESDGTENAYVYNFADQELEAYNQLAQLFESFNSAWD